jgi:hypothetical protein
MLLNTLKLLRLTNAPYVLRNGQRAVRVPLTEMLGKWHTECQTTTDKKAKPFQ